MFASGIAVDYGKSVLVAKEGSAKDQGDGTDVMGSHEGAHSKQDLATNVKLGMRMPSYKVLSQADARPWHFQELLKSNGRWRLIVFPGDILDPSQAEKMKALGEKLSAPSSFLRRYTPPSHRIDSLIECLAIHSSPRVESDIFNFPPIFRPFSETDGYDYSKIYVDDESYHEGHGEAYKNYGINDKTGCAVILRPDQYVSWVGDAFDYEMMDRFFSAFMRTQKTANSEHIEAPADLYKGGAALEREDSKMEAMDGSTNGVPHAPL